MACRTTFRRMFVPLRGAVLLLLGVATATVGALAAQGQQRQSTISGQHWSYVAPHKSALPTTANDRWLRQPLDAFIAARLEAEQRSPAPQADRTTLIRRVTLDLTGLPPTPDEVAAFLADESPDAYERLVDRLLASPRYGERMAVPWLDLARYADTHGYHSDSERHMWRWRDWVVDALNRGMPYDQFTVEQLAGDLLPSASLEQRLATGFHRNHMLNDENGAIPEEYLAEYVAERASTTATVWLGQTLACARCHDHKHDPFTQREFFQLYAFFNSVPENGLGGRNGNAPPVLNVPTHAQQRELAEIDHRLQQVDSALVNRERSPAIARDLADWLAQWSNKADAASQPPSDATLRFAFDETAGDAAANSVDPQISARLHGNPTWIDGKFGQALLCDGQTYGEVKSVIANEADTPFTLSAWVFPTTNDRLPILSRLDETQYRRGFEWGIEKRALYFNLTHAAEKDELAVRSQPTLTLNRWQHVALGYDGSGKAAGVKLLVDGKPIDLDVERDNLSQHVATDQLLQIGRGDSTTLFRGMLDELQVFPRTLSTEEVARLAGGDPLREIARLPETERTPEQQSALRSYYLEHIDPEFRSLLAEQRKLQRRRAEIERDAPSVMVMAEMPSPRPTHVHLAGRYDLPGEQVTPDVPRVLPPLPQDGPKNRLSLARWLVSPQHPLTARVAANRQWQIIFGEALVRTPDDFGLLGERPTHPELLDWLACELMDRGWDLKTMHRQMVTSATYRQSSEADPQLLEDDPDNRLWARSSSKRLPAEMVRDAALQSAGILQTNLGGPAVKPYQPAELWSELAYNATDYSAQVFRQSHGADLYRRSLYTFWKRSVPPPNLALLDAPDRELCSAVRATTESPLQALVLLNDTTFVEAARLLAERAIKAHDESAGRIDFVFRAVLSRGPTSAEADLLAAFAARQQDRYASDPAAAKSLLQVGEAASDQSLAAAELAAWTNVALTVLNLDEAITRP